MKLQSVFFCNDIRVNGNFMKGVVFPEDAGKWDGFVDMDARVVKLRGMAKYEGQLLVVPFENVSVIRVLDEAAPITVKKR